MTISHGASALDDGWLRLQTRTQNMKYFSFSTATTFVRTRLNVTFIRLYIACLVIVMKFLCIVS